MFSALDIIRDNGGIVPGSLLHQFGFTRQQLAALVNSGDLDRPRGGVFALPHASESVRTAAAHGGALTCASVLVEHGIWTLNFDSRVHVWIARGRHPRWHRGCTCVTHVRAGKPPVGATDLVTALIHYRQCAGDEAFFAAFESAWRLGKLTAQDRASLRQQLPAKAKWLLDFARPDADSGLESLLRLRLHLLGVELQTQVRIPNVGIVDAVVERVVILEADGRENHEGPEKRHKDLARDAAASALGFETLRFDYRQIVFEWPTVRDAVLAALTRAGARTAAGADTKNTTLDK